MTPSGIDVGSGCTPIASCRLERLENVVMLPSGITADADTTELVMVLMFTIKVPVAVPLISCPDGHTVAIAPSNVLEDIGVDGKNVPDACRACIC